MVVMVRADLYEAESPRSSSQGRSRFVYESPRKSLQGWGTFYAWQEQQLWIALAGKDLCDLTQSTETLNHTSVQ